MVSGYVTLFLASFLNTAVAHFIRWLLCSPMRRWLGPRHWSRTQRGISRSRRRSSRRRSRSIATSAHDIVLNPTGLVTASDIMAGIEDLDGVHDDEVHSEVQRPPFVRQISPRGAADTSARMASMEGLNSKLMTDPIFVQMMKSGYTEEDALSFAKEAGAAWPQQTLRGPVLALRQIGKFSIRIWDEDFIIDQA